MSENKRRRIDRVQDADFLSGLDDLDPSELRHRRMMCDNLEIELSYYRRMLHGRLDLVAFEMRRRAGEEEQTLLQALPRILSEGAYTATTGLPTRAVAIGVPDLPRRGRRIVDKALDSDFLARLPELDDEELGDIQRFLEEIEAMVSQQRGVVHRAIDTLQAEIARRYAAGTADPGEVLPSE